MLSQLLSLHDWHLYLVLAAGCVSTGVALALGFRLTHQETPKRVSEILTVSGWMRKVCPQRRRVSDLVERVEQSWR
jgi:hypothetical protein